LRAKKRILTCPQKWPPATGKSVTLGPPPHPPSSLLALCLAQSPPHPPAASRNLRLVQLPPSLSIPLLALRLAQPLPRTTSTSLALRQAQPLPHSLSASHNLRLTSLPPRSTFALLTLRLAQPPPYPPSTWGNLRLTRPLLSPSHQPSAALALCLTTYQPSAALALCLTTPSIHLTRLPPHSHSASLPSSCPPSTLITVDLAGLSLAHPTLLVLRFVCSPSCSAMVALASCITCPLPRSPSTSLVLRGSTALPNFCLAHPLPRSPSRSTYTRLAHSPVQLTHGSLTVPFNLHTARSPPRSTYTRLAHRPVQLTHGSLSSCSPGHALCAVYRKVSKAFRSRCSLLVLPELACSGLIRPPAHLSRAALTLARSRAADLFRTRPARSLLHYQKVAQVEILVRGQYTSNKYTGDSVYWK